MNKQEFSEGIASVVSCCGEIDDNMAAFLWRKFMTAPSATWRKICERVITSTRYKPKIADFMKAAEAIGPGINQPGAERKTCKECDGIGFLRSYVIANEMPYESLEPCQRCNANAIKAGSHKAEVCKITREKYEQLAGVSPDYSNAKGQAAVVRRLPPPVVRGLLEEIEARRIEYPQGVMAAFIERAGEDGKTNVVRLGDNAVESTEQRVERGRAKNKAKVAEAIEAGEIDTAKMGAPAVEEVW